MIPSDPEKEAGREGLALFGYLQEALARVQIPYEFLYHHTGSAWSPPADASCFFAKEIVKGMTLRADDRLVMVVLPVNAEIDLEIIKNVLQADLLQPALLLDDEILSGKSNLPPAYVDLALLENEKIAFSTGKGTPLIRMKTVDFLKLVSPCFGNFCLRQTTSI
jgi:prolyl-tRNA editing enzyme YbaK/EbsC (Cys-tRNA(Pro) deacylase)